MTELTPETCETIDDVRGLLRSVVYSPAGLATVDASQIEARGLLWLAGDEEGLDVYRRGEDAYKRFAGRVYGVEVEAVTKPQRQVGKIGVLGCLAEGTPVLTRQRGWIAIESVTPSDMLWDGVEWVGHDGVVCNGIRECLQVEGVWLTEDHEILTDCGWRAAGSLASTRCSNGGRYLADGRCLLTSPSVEAPTLPSSAAASAGPSTVSTPTTFGAGSARNATGAPAWRKPRPACGAAAGETQSLTRASASAGKAGSRRSSRGASAPDPAAGPTTAVGESASTLLGSGTGQPSPATSRLSPGGTSRPSSSIGSTTREVMSPGTSAWQPARSNAGTPAPIGADATSNPANYAGTSSESATREAASAPSAAPGERRTCRVYDVLNAGPRSRFQAGRLIAHNCGYGAGAKAIGAQAVQRGVDLAAAGVTATQVVERWRDTHWRVAGERTGYEFVPEADGEESDPIQERRGGLWRELRDTFRLAALRVGGKHYAAGGRISFHWEPTGLDGTAGGDVVCLLPSGREIRYRQTREEQVPDKFNPGETKKAWTYAAPRGGRAHVYGGLLAENTTQALCRDLLALGMVRLEAAGYRVVLHVHDEVVVELDPAGPSAEEQFAEIKRIMAQIPPWAEGLPFEVAGGVDQRWRK